MSGRRRQSLAPTLFPFLAVLVCTLGTLILLLALVAQNTSDAAQQLAELPADLPEDQPDELTVGDVQRLVEEEEFRLGELVSFREAQTGDLEDRRNQLAHVEDHMRRIRERLREISESMEQVASDEPVPVTTEEELRSLREELAKEEKVVKKLREEIKTEKPRFVIVPHQGPNGTNRRPIYLECTSKGVTIWPEGVALTKWQLEKSSADANPLDDALRAARYHAMQQYGDTIPPYPLLLVRPDGVETYYAARAAMMDWDDQFGYELVPAGIELAYPQPDPAMRERMQYAVNEALNRVTQQSIARSMIGKSMAGRGSRNPGSRNPSAPAGGRGNFDRDATGRGNGPAVADGNIESSPAKMPRLSVAEMDRQGRRSGFRDHRMFPTQTYGSSRSTSGSPISSEAAKRRLERQLADSASSFDSESDQGLNGSAQTAVDEIQKGAAGSGTANGSRPDDPNNGEQQYGQQKRDSSEMWLNEPSVAQENASASEASGGDALTQVPGNSDTGGRRPSRQSNSSAANNPGAFGPSSGAMAGMNQMGQQQVSQQQRAGANQNSMSAQPPTTRRQSTQNPQPRPSRMVQRRGVDWALPSSVSLGQGNEIIRSIRIQVYADRFVILPGGTERSSESFLIQSLGVDLATLQLATSVRDRIDRWGAAAPGARWSPRLKVDVMPGAELRFSEFEKLLTGSGLPIQRSGYQQADANQQEAVR